MIQRKPDKRKKQGLSEEERISLLANMVRAGKAPTYDSTLGALQRAWQKMDEQPRSYEQNRVLRRVNSAVADLGGRFYDPGHNSGREFTPEVLRVVLYSSNCKSPEAAVEKAYTLLEKLGVTNKDNEFYEDTLQPDAPLAFEYLAFVPGDSYGEPDKSSNGLAKKLSDAGCKNVFTVDEPSANPLDPRKLHDFDRKSAAYALFQSAEGSTEGVTRIAVQVTYNLEAALAGELNNIAEQNKKDVLTVLVPY